MYIESRNKSNGTPNIQIIYHNNQKITLSPHPNHNHISQLILIDQPAIKKTIWQTDHVRNVRLPGLKSVTESLNLQH